MSDLKAFARNFIAVLLAATIVKSLGLTTILFAAVIGAVVYLYARYRAGEAAGGESEELEAEKK